MGYDEEERNIKPPPRGWAPPPKKIAHNIGQIVYNGGPNQPLRKADAVSRRHYIIKKPSGVHLTQEMRENLGRAWNKYVNSSTTISLRRFARLHNLAYATWQRELKRGATGPIIRKGKR